MMVDVEYLRELSGAPGPGLLSEALTTERTADHLRKWYAALGGAGCSETQAVALLRRATDMSDAAMLDAFDLLDAEQRGALTFPAFFLLVALLAGREERQLRLFLFHRGADAAKILLEPADPAGGPSTSGETYSISRLAAFARCFALEEMLLERVRDIAGKRQDLSKDQLQALLFAVAEHHDLSSPSPPSAAAPPPAGGGGAGGGGGGAPAPPPRRDLPSASPQGGTAGGGAEGDRDSGGAAAGGRTSVCDIS